MRGRDWWRPLSAPPWQAVGEAIAAYVVAIVLGGTFNGFAAGAGALISTVLVALGWLALGFWPAWRTYRVPGRWRTRLPLGIGRAFLMVITLALATVVITILVNRIVSFWPISGARASSFPAVMILIAVLFAVTRIAVLLGWWALDRARRRLRWQLMASHVGVILLTLAALTAMGSVVGIAIGLYSVQPNSVEMANSVHDQLELTGKPLDTATIRRVFLAINSRRIPLRGQAPLSALIGGNAVGPPREMALLAPDGRVLVAVESSSGVLPIRRWSGLAGLTAKRWRAIDSGVTTGQAVSLDIPSSGGPPAADRIAAVPLASGRGRPDILLIATRAPGISALEFFQASILVFGATTIVLIVIAGIPLLAISFLFSYLVARGLTRRLEAVSGVATAIAGGNFEQRAPARSTDEIGRLADDLNRMAAKLQELVGELTQARLQAEEDLRSRQELVANVSHELRTPVAVLRAQLESIEARTAVMAAGGSDQAVPVPPGTIEALYGETLRLATMIDDLFALSRASTGTLALNTEPVDVRAVVDEVTEFMRPLAQRESAVTLSADVPPDLPPVAGDRGRLHQILSNLVRNAIRHTPEGGIVVIAAGQDADRVVLSVSDTGEGIAPEDLPRVFERFYPADRSRGRETGGAGLGLAIVRELVELMGGSVAVESEPGQGSRFTVSLPIATRCT